MVERPAGDSNTTSSSGDNCLAGGGEMGALMRSMDWSATALGAVAGWPQSLRTAISIMLDSRFAMVVAWGPEFRFFYNDRYRPVLGATKHPGALGTPAAVIFPEAWPFIGPLFNATRRGDSVALDDHLIPLDRNGYLEDCYFTLSYSPIRDESGGVGGMLAVVAETTERVQGERRLATLRDLLRAAGDARTAERACENAARILDKNAVDVPFSLFYVLDDDAKTARRVAASGLDGDSAACPRSIDCSADDPRGWPIARAVRSRQLELVADLPDRFGALPGGPYPEPTHSAVVIALAKPGHDHPYAVLIAGVSPRRAFDDAYRGFFDLAADHVLSAIANARAFQEERERSEALEAIDRAKTAFFSNVSHEFRTPLTLMLGPAEDALADRANALSDVQRERIELVRRNGLRLQKLVNTLLDFARLEAGRTQACFVPTDLAALTSELASSFRSVVVSAGLDLVVDCFDLPQPVYVDPSMWEKIVLNLISNAFKFTFKGRIRVGLRSVGDRVELSVSDTGTGIPREELPRLFERFYRVDGARGRSHEGTGIGLSLVQELVKLHGGLVEVESTQGEGSTFRVVVPYGCAHLPADRSGNSERTLASTGVGPAGFLSEVAQWNKVGSEPPPLASPVGTLPAQQALEPGARILVVDDNADMRDYVARLLSPHCQVETASDGVEALAAACAQPPDLILSDVMMPGMDGLSLLRALRADARTRTIPVVLLSARAGEEATIAGLESGADEYLVKPFSAKELIARVSAQLAAARQRREALEVERRQTEQVERLLDEARRSTQAREDILAIVSHDLRTPLSIVRLNAALIERARIDGEHADRVRRKAEAIQSAADRMERLIADLLDVASIEAGTLSVAPERQSIEALVSEARDAFASQAAERNLRFDVEVEPGLVEVVGDKERMLQVLSNLLSNAVRFTDAGGEVALRVRRQSDGVLFSVTDTGRGIAPEALSHVFDRYWHSAQHGREGHGLGLSIAKGIVQAHGGTIAAHSVLGRGTTFSFLIPLLPGIVPAASTKVAAAERPSLPRASTGVAGDQFVSTASHELRTPLTALRIHLESLLRRITRDQPESADNRVVDKLVAALRQVDRMTRLVEGLLDVSRTSLGSLDLEREEFDLADLVRKVVDLSQADARAVGSRFHLEATPARGSWDPVRIEQVITSLISNAVKYAPGTQIDVVVQADRNDAVVVVRDAGMGIHAEDLSRILDQFEHFVSVEQHAGVGMSLYLARKLVEAHGGSLLVESSPGRGATLTVRLPGCASHVPSAPRVETARAGEC